MQGIPDRRRLRTCRCSVASATAGRTSAASQESADSLLSRAALRGHDALRDIADPSPCFEGLAAKSRVITEGGCFSGLRGRNRDPPPLLIQISCGLRFGPLADFDRCIESFLLDTRRTAGKQVSPLAAYASAIMVPQLSGRLVEHAPDAGVLDAPSSIQAKGLKDFFGRGDLSHDDAQAAVPEGTPLKAVQAGRRNRSAPKKVAEPEVLHGERYIEVAQALLASATAGSTLHVRAYSLWAGIR